MRPEWFATLILTVVVATAARAEVWDFERAEPGQLPRGWTAAKTGSGPGSVWQVTEDKSAPKGPKVLTQTSSKGPRPLFNLCVADATSYTDVDLRVSLKALKGKIDQGGGPVWRYRDPDNYYICRVNPLELNYRVYKVVGGKRSQLASADVEVDDDVPDADARKALLGKWHTIRVIHRGDHIRCYLGGKLLLEVRDDTFRGPGKLGLWAKADAVTSFDAVSVDVPKQRQ